MEKKRVPVKAKKDQKIFKKTANATNKLNSNPPTFRGGIRL